ncbi:uncharacterized protein A1O9_12660 [Exophiala aquamarina CBS 119918]|uniref:Uncharacterized protein n=1 Tax=Exophiala aquamarina CBS 119918 TaxID=1182545 RepID=A0A072P6V9_9EURO|nr:uncharacterized protein A1O9_12660 [Exophiala aquamarina CBS 119918]KEF51310.1 hypothetical protein A1O9_12660 [Exophiala aquamarina CBS 119918]
MAETTTSSTTKRKRGRPAVDARYDNWYGVQDAKERKRIQDRLAQRARRGRMISAVPNREEKSKSTGRTTDGPSTSPEDSTFAPTSTSSSSSSNDNGHDHELIQVADGSCLIVSGPSAIAKVVAWRGGYTRSNATGVSLDHWFLCWPAWSIYAALTKHGLMLGTSCAECVYDSVSPSAYESLPDALKPTPLQLVVPHRRWIDRFPFIRLRDNMILLNTLLDLDEFCGDLFNTVSLTLRPSAPSWDPRSWVLGEEFATKWGYLFR